MKVITLEQFHEEMRAQGVPVEKILFKCPMCGTLQCAEDLITAGAGKTMEEVEKYLGFSCVGRFTHGKPPPSHKGKHQEGCNWTLGGLFKTHQLEVVVPETGNHMRFEVATPEEARAHWEAKAKK